MILHTACSRSAASAGAMRHLRQLVLAALALVLCFPPVAGARGPSKLVGQLVTPYARVDGLNGGEAMGEMWYRGYTLPAIENQALGNGKPCVRLGRSGSILVGVEFQPGPCTVDQGTTVFIWGISWACDNASEDIDPSSYGADEAAQIRCALNGLREEVESLSLSVDGRSVDLHARQYLICSRQRRLQLRSDNPAGYPPGRATFTACGYVAWLKHLPPGQHMIQTVTTFFDASEPHELSLVINVVEHHDTGGRMP